MIRYFVNQQVTHIVLDKPERLNSLARADIEELARCWARFQGDVSTTVAIVSGEGGRAFSSGIDVKDEQTLSVENSQDESYWADPTHGIGQTLEDGIPVWKPVIAAIDGYCLGAGLTLALGADIRLCTRQSQFGMPEVRIGVSTVTGAALLPRLMNPSLAAEMLLAGRTLTADEVAQGGLVSRVYATRSELDAAAQALAGDIAQNAPLAVRATKEVMRRSWDLPLGVILPWGEAMRSLVLASEDYAEGITALRTSRTPRYTGR